jgi:hypothetical protein
VALRDRQSLVGFQSAERLGFSRGGLMVDRAAVGCKPMFGGGS